jgi:copper chaperone
MEKTSLQVSGMSCNHCVATVEGSVGKLNGVNSVKVNLDSGKVLVEYDPSGVTLDMIKEEIEEQGYDVV